MDRYTETSNHLSRNFSLDYSASFAAASRLYESSVREHIYHIFSWAWLGEEITSQSVKDKAEVLNKYRSETFEAIKTGFSTNPIIHSFAQTARQFDIKGNLIKPYFASLKMDIVPPKIYTKQNLDTYLHGASGVLWLMCLKVSTINNQAKYTELEKGTEALAKAFKKIDLLREISTNPELESRGYFAGISTGKLTEARKQKIINSIRHDFTHALPALDQLPKSSRTAITVMARYYYTLLEKLAVTPVETFAKRRIQLPEWRKAQIVASVTAQHSLKRARS